MGNGFFEVAFASTEGVRQTLSRVYHLDGQEVQFSPWHADFSAHNPASATTLEFPIWIQILGLGIHLRHEAILRIIGSKFGQVLHYDGGASFAGRTAGPRIKILVKADMTIPERILLPGAHPDVLHSHKLIASGNPNQCASCNAFGHNSRTCPQNPRNISRARSARERPRNRRGGRNQWQDGGQQRQHHQCGRAQRAPVRDERPTATRAPSPAPRVAGTENQNPPGIHYTRMANIPTPARPENGESWKRDLGSADHEQGAKGEGSSDSHQVGTSNSNRAPTQDSAHSPQAQPDVGALIPYTPTAGKGLVAAAGGESSQRRPFSTANQRRLDLNHEHTPSREMGSHSNATPNGADFIWRSTRGQPSSQPASASTAIRTLATLKPGSRSAQGHRTSTVPSSFWTAAGMVPQTTSEAMRGRVYPILCTITKDPSRPQEVILNLLTPIRAAEATPVSYRQVTVLEDKNIWTRVEARTQIVNEASIALRPILSQRYTSHNPLAEWNDAIWLYKWLEDAEVGCHNIILACLPINPEETQLLRPADFHWVPLHPSAQHMILRNDLGNLGEIEDHYGPIIKMLLGEDLIEVDPSPQRPGFRKTKTAAVRRALGLPAASGEGSISHGLESLSFECQ